MRWGRAGASDREGGRGHTERTLFRGRSWSAGTESVHQAHPEVALPGVLSNQLNSPLTCPQRSVNMAQDQTKSSTETGCPGSRGKAVGGLRHNEGWDGSLNATPSCIINAENVR